MDHPPHHRRGPWSNTEDRFLLNLIERHGPLNWVRIAQILGSRSPKQCRERYHQNLKPSLNHDPITPEEGAMIENLSKTGGTEVRTEGGDSSAGVLHLRYQQLHHYRRLRPRLRLDMVTECNELHFHS
ncbi:trichome differentiation protein GL1 [Metarhizium album ARSEF 1941]|uniref:Trichome differentiation protein GL1 n=1 Tax=Metarhizium album (strain ARSEF 1941) TaxID=1081103 RepID=A0A0B2X3H6_METAS|nr:trichome differentiation protein GL1 [Metarhizium album ARSEF 1941]KHO00899.1 trichome differentiation protein GL1 [Metarhizium album ARSEF 1941]